MAFKAKIDNFIEKISHVEDPIESTKYMVTYIQRLVGIHNVFGDKKQSKKVFANLLLREYYTYLTHHNLLLLALSFS